MRGYTRGVTPTTHSTARQSHEPKKEKEKPIPLEERLASVIPRDEEPEVKAKPKKRPKIGKPIWSRLRTA